MEIRTEYKQTEVGAIPSDWSLLPLDKLIDEKRPIRYGIVQPGKYHVQGRFMVRGQDYSFGWADPSTLFRVSAEVEERYKNARLKTGDLILTIVGAGTGHFEIVPLWLEGANITQTTARISIDESKVDSRFCKYFFQSKAGRNQISLYIKGAAQPGLNIGDVRTFIVPLPAKSEQNAIATALSDTDALITSLENLIAKKRNIKQGAMQELLKPKKGWHSENLENLASITTGNKNTQDRVETGKYPFFVRSQTIERINSYSFDGEAILTAGDGVGTGKVFHYIKGRFDFHQRVYKLSDFREDINGHYLFIYFSNHFYGRIMQMTAKSSVDSVRLEMIAKMKIPVPTIKEQIAISSTLSDMDQEIASLESKLEKYLQIKSGMMQNLLTGKIRLI